MKILHLLASPVFSGPAETVLNLAIAQRALGHQVGVAVERKRAGLSSEEPIVPRMNAAGLLDESGLELSTHSRWTQMFRDARRLRRQTLDVVHAHFSHDHWIARWGKPPGAIVIRSIHSPRSLRWSMPKANGYTVPVAAWGSRWPARTVHVLPAMIDASFMPPTDLLALRQALRLEGSPVFGMTSTLQPSRRHALALEAFARIRASQSNARLVWVGDGVLEDELRGRVKALGLTDAVTFAGYLSGEAFVRQLQALDQLWIFGLGNDWSARAAVQARRCGVRVVGMKEGALPNYADAVVEPLSAEGIQAAADRVGQRRSVALPDNETEASLLFAFYRACGAPA